MTSFIIDALRIQHKEEREITLYGPITTELKSEYTACEGTEVELLPNVKGGSPPYQYFWTNQTTSVTTHDPGLIVQAGSQPVTYTLSIEDARSDRFSGFKFYEKTFTVEASQISVNAGNSVTLCGLDDTGNLGASVNGGSGSYTTLWEPYNHLSSVSSVHPVVGADSPGVKTYTLTATDEYGCNATDQVNVYANETLQIDLDPTYFLYGLESITISPVVSKGSGSYSYSWSNGATTKDIQVNYLVDLNISLTVTDIVTGCKQDESITILHLGSKFTNKQSIARGGSWYKLKIPVTSSLGNFSYTASTNVPWLRILSGTNGYTGNTIIIEMLKNNSSGNREGKIILKSPEAINSPYEITVTQNLNNVIYVPTDYLTIQEAINEAPDGSKVEVHEGVYNEHIVFSGSKKISVKAIGCPENTIIRGGNSLSPLVKFDGDNSILQGFTITGNNNGSGYYHNRAGGIEIQGSPELYDLVVSNNIGYTGGGIGITGGSPVIVNVKIMNNIANLGGGVSISSSEIVNLSNVLITGNIAKGPENDNCHPCANGAGGGLFCSGYANLNNVTLQNNLVYMFGQKHRNYDNYRCGISIAYDGSISFISCIITDAIGSDNNGSTGNNKATFYFTNFTPYDINGPVKIDWTYGNIKDIDPMLAADFSLLSGSPCINSGAPGSPIDLDGTRNDMGFTGGKGKYNNTAYVCTKGATYPVMTKVINIGVACNPLLVYNSGEKENFIATQQIIIKSGFSAKTGSELSFKIKPYYNEPFQYDGRCNFLQSTQLKTDTLNAPSEYSKTDKSNNSDISVILYPNPTNSNFTLEILGDPQMVQSIEVYNVQGQLITLKDDKIECTNNFDLSGYPQGVYIIKINNFENQIIKKIIKE